jgi:hypothetical protein
VADGKGLSPAFLVEHREGERESNIYINISLYILYCIHNMGIKKGVVEHRGAASDVI